MLDAREDAPGRDEDDPFGTPTMAELFAAQGRVADAMAIYRRLIAADPDGDEASGWRDRLVRLERAQRHADAPAPAPVPARKPGTASVAASTPAAVTLPLLVAEPVRSGQLVRAHERDLIVLAAVNPGAQLVADGHIHVYGPLRGRAMAGASGCREARIFCQRLEAELVAIAGVHVAAEDVPAAWLGRAVQIVLRGDRCAFLPL
jgi:septum site-determining protein MinC